MLKQRLGIQTERRTEASIEPVHTPSLSIGNSLGEIKVGLMSLKTQLDRIEGCMLSREYFDQSMETKDKTKAIIARLDQALRILTELQPRKPSKPSVEPRRPSFEPSLTEEAEDHVKAAIESLRLRQVMEVFNNREKTTPKQLAGLLGIKNNTATEHLRRLEDLGYVRRVSRGLYEPI
jgi:hypothetical protein